MSVPTPTKPPINSRDMPTVEITRIVSGGQTGVDRGALDAAADLGLAHGGWCPRGRRAEDGVIPSRYELQETESARYDVRTLRNVLDSDGTLVFCCTEPQGGTALTVRLARQHARPLCVVDLDQPLDFVALDAWAARNAIRVLNVAGPRESNQPGIARAARDALAAWLSRHRVSKSNGG
ncbi:MAG: putative molybdenum carrier protein [Pirellulales bacterium]